MEERALWLLSGTTEEPTIKQREDRSTATIDFEEVEADDIAFESWSFKPIVLQE